MDNKNELNIKSLKSFKEETLVHILPFRYRNDKLEILLHESIEEKNIFTDFAGLFMKMDVNQIFCAARILYNFFHENVFTLSLYV